MSMCVIVTEIMFKDPSATSTKKTTKMKPVSEKSSSLLEALNSSTQSESPKSSHEGRTAPPKTFPKIKVWIMSIDPAIKVTVLMKKPFPFSFFSCFMCVFSFPNFSESFPATCLYLSKFSSLCSFSIFIVDSHAGILSLQTLMSGRTCNIHGVNSV